MHYDTRRVRSRDPPDLTETPVSADPSIGMASAVSKPIRPCRTNRHFMAIMFLAGTAGIKMAKLDAKDRRDMPKSEFGLPGKRAYPMPDKSHASNAKARASEMVNKGKMSKSTEEKIDAKADRKLDDKKEPMKKDGGKKTPAVMDIKVMPMRHDPGSVADRQKDMKMREDRAAKSRK